MSHVQLAVAFFVVHNRNPHANFRLRFFYDCDASFMTSSDPNPYRAPPVSPETPARDLTPEHPERESLAPAEFLFKICLAIVAIPAVANFIAFDQKIVAELGNEWRWQHLYTNLAIFSLSSVLLWQWGYALLEGLLVLPASWVPGLNPEVGGRNVVRRNMRRFCWLTIIGSVLWLVWIVGFFFDLPFLASQPGKHLLINAVSSCGMAAVLLWFGDLVFHWHAESKRSLADPPE